MIERKRESSRSSKLFAIVDASVNIFITSCSFIKCSQMKWTGSTIFLLSNAGMIIKFDSQHFHIFFPDLRSYLLLLMPMLISLSHPAALSNAARWGGLGALLFSRVVLELELPVDGDKLGGFGDTPYLGEGDVLYLGEALADFDNEGWPVGLVLEFEIIELEPDSGLVRLGI